MNSRGLDRACRAVLDEARARNIFRDWAKAAAEINSAIYYNVKARIDRLLRALERAEQILGNSSVEYHSGSTLVTD